MPIMWAWAHRVGNAQHMRLLQAVVLLAVCLAVVPTSASSRQLAAARAVRYINAAWTLAGSCDSEQLAGIEAKLRDATLRDIKRVTNDNKAQLEQTGGCKDITVDYFAGTFAGYMWQFSFTGTVDTRNKLVRAGRRSVVDTELRISYGNPDPSVWRDVVRVPENDLPPQPNEQPRKLRANFASGEKDVVFTLANYARPGPPRGSSPSPKPSPTPSPSPALSPNPSPAVSPSPGPNPSPSPSPSPSLATCNRTSTGLPFQCPAGFVLKPNPDSILNPNATVCCNAAPNCANVSPSLTNSTQVPWTCPSGYLLAPNASSITTLSDATCCVLRASCANVNATAGGSSFQCPAGTQLVANASFIFDISANSCCAPRASCGNVNGTTPAVPFTCPSGSVLKPNATIIFDISATSCCSLLSCANAGGSSSQPFVCPSGFVLSDNATSIFNLTAASCCVARPTCTNINPTLPTGNSTVNITAWSCPPDAVLRPNASSITVLSTATCCEVVPSNCSSIPDSVSVNGTCQCTKPGFTVQALDGTRLRACLASPAAFCRDPYPIAVRGADPNSAIVACMTATTTTCPAGYTLPSWGGIPLRLMECRPQSQGCQGPYDFPVFGANGSTPIACVRPSDNACPPGSVAYREWNSAVPWSLQRCAAVSMCANAAANETRFTVMAKDAQGTLVGCFTLDPATQACPGFTNGSVLNPGIPNFPLEVTTPQPDGCGNSNATCTTSRTTQCLTPLSTCPAGMLQLYRYMIASDIPSELVGCMPMRAACDLTQTSLAAGGTNPTAANYSIRALVNSTLMGCVQQGATACPNAYPFPTRNNGMLQDCNTNGVSIASCPLPSNPLFTVEAVNLNGVVVECLNPLDPQGCPPNYPIAARFLAGTPPAVTIDQCMARAANTMCTAPFPFPFYARVQGLVQVTNCWKSGSVTDCNFPITNGPLGEGVGTYNIPIVTANIGLQGCLLQGTMTCPASFNFAYYDRDANGPNGRRLSRCAFNGTCTPPYTLPITDQGSLVGCATNEPPSGCPPDYPVLVVPTSTSVNPQQCLSMRSQCASVPGNFVFSLYKLSSGPDPRPVLDKCIPNAGGLASCNATTLTAGYTNLELFNSGGELVGCTTSEVTTCPAEFRYAFYDITGAVVSCRSNITEGLTCAQVSAGRFPTPVLDSQGRLTGCAAATSGCPDNPNVVVIAETATSPIEACLSITSGQCPAAGFGDRAFPLYSGATPSGTPKLVRCIKPPATSDCSNTTGTFTAEIKNSADWNGTLVGCMQPTGTPCPTFASFPYLSSGADGVTLTLAECRLAPASSRCDAAAPANYSISMTTADGATLKGCLQNGAKRCPSKPEDAFNFPFFLLNELGIVEECRQPGEAISSCAANFTSYKNGTYGISVINSKSFGVNSPVVGCVKSSASSSCTAASGYPIAQVSSAGVWEACRPTGTACPSTGAYSVTLASAAVGIQGCGDFNITGNCPTSGNWQFSQYEGNGAAPATLSACWAAAGITNCDNSTLFGMDTAEVMDGAVLKGCTSRGGQCPATYPFPYVEAAGSSFELSRCQRAPIPATCPAGFGVELRNTAGLQGCLQDGAGRCPAAGVWNYGFPLRSSSGALDECWEVAAPVSNCSATFPSYSVVITTNLNWLQGAPAASTIVGCMSISATTCLVAGFTNAQLSATGTLQFCRPSSITSCPTGTRYSVQLRDANRTAFQGCADFSATGDCPSTGNWQFSLYEKASTGPAASLKECLAVAAGALASCDSLAGYPVEVVETANNRLRGCSVPDAQCPTGFPRWILDDSIAPVLLACKSSAGFTAAQCTAAAPIQMRSSPDGGVPGDLVGCKGVPATGPACPTTAPANQVPSSTAYSFYIVNADGDVTECRPAGGNGCSGGLIPLKSGGDGVTTVGCAPATAGGCPGVFFPMWKASDPAVQNATAILAECWEGLPQPCPASYPIPVYSTRLGAATPIHKGCKTAAAACPQPYPVMALSASTDATAPSLEACHGIFTGGATCPAGAKSIPVCLMPINPVEPAGVCRGSSVQGCLGSSSTRCFTANGFNNIGRYPFVVASVSTAVAPPAIDSLQACYQDVNSKIPAWIVTCPSGYLRAVNTVPTEPSVACVSLSPTSTVAQCTEWVNDYMGILSGSCRNN